MMTPDEMEAAVRSYFQAYLAVDRSVVEAALHPDFTFTSPYDDHIDGPTYFSRCWRNAGIFDRFDVIEVRVAGDHCFVLYEARTVAGAGIRNVERFAFEGGKLRSVEVFFGLGPGETPAVPGGDEEEDDA